MYVSKERRKDFRPSGNFRGLHRAPEVLLPRESDLQRQREEEEERRRAQLPRAAVLLDAETGEALSPTRAHWSTREGRLGLTARAILDMGTGRLDLAVRAAAAVRERERETHAAPSSSAALPSPSQCASRSTAPHPLVAQFLSLGPLTPYMHTQWDPRTNRIVRNEDHALDDETAASSDTDSLLHKPLPAQHTTTTQKRETKSERVVGDAADVVPRELALHREKNWNAILEKTFLELYSFAEQAELNKSLTGEDKTPGGLSAVRRACQDLARLKVKNMKELVQAVDDEARKEAQRELAEFESLHKEALLAEVQKKNKEARLRGKQYIEAMQRDHEIVFMLRMRAVGLLW